MPRFHWRILLFVFISLTGVGKSFSQNWLWARNGNAASNNGSDVGDVQSVATDNFGNIFSTGIYSGPYIKFGNLTLNNSGQAQIFLVKYDPNGNPIWVTGPPGEALGSFVTTDGNGNIYLTGYFLSQTITFGSFTLSNSGNIGTEDLFIAKYNPSGTVIWAQSFGGTGNYDEGLSVATDNSGNVFLTGRFDSPSISFGTYNLNNIGTTDIFLVKLDLNGNVLWAKDAGGPSGDRASSISTDNLGNLYITGQYSSPINFGTINLNTGNGFFLAKYDTQGNAQWVRNSISNNSCAGYSCATAITNNIYVTGFFSGSNITFGSFTLTNTSVGKYDIFLLDYDSSGNEKWAKGGGGRAYDAGYSVITNNNSDAIYLSGYYGNFSTAGDTLIFGSQIIYPDTSLGMYGGFLIKFDTLGNALCSDAVKSAGDDQIVLANDPLGNNVYLAGDIFHAYDPFVFSLDTLTGIGVEYPFLAKWTCSIEGISEEYLSRNLKIFPNPTSGKFQLEINDLQNIDSEVEIYDVLGNKIFNSNISSSKNEIDLSSQPNGIYFLRVTSGKEILSQKIIISK